MEPSQSGDLQNHEGHWGRTSARLEAVLKTTLEVLVLAKGEAQQAGLGNCAGNFPFKTTRTGAPFISMRMERRLGSEGPKVFVFERASSVFGSKSLRPELQGWAGIQHTLPAAWESGESYPSGRPEPRGPHSEMQPRIPSPTQPTTSHRCKWPSCTFLKCLPLLLQPFISFDILNPVWKKTGV